MITRHVKIFLTFTLLALYAWTAQGEAGTAPVSSLKDTQWRLVEFFRMGKPIGADTSEADDPGKFGATREADLNFIRIGNEHYEIPDAVVLGG